MTNGQFTWRYYTTIITVAVGASFQFYSCGVVNPTQTIITKWMKKLTESQLTLLWSFTTSSIAIGACIGSLLTRVIAEKIGRRNGLIVNGCVNVVAAMLELFSTMAASPEMLIGGRFILGACMGITSGLAPMYLTEISPVRVRGAAGAAHQIAVAFGDWFSLLVALPQVLGSERLWPFAFALPGFPAAILVVVLPFMPHSPKHQLLTRQDPAAARAAVAQLVTAEYRGEFYEQLVGEAGTVALDRQAGFCAILRRQRFRTPMLICILVMVAQQATGPSVVFLYSTNIFINARLSVEVAQYATLAVGVAYFIFVIPSAYLIEHRGRRFLSITQLCGCWASLVALTLFIWLQTEYRYPWTSYASIGALIVWVCIYGLGSPIPWLIASEIFSQEYRSAAVTVSTFTAWALAFGVTTVYLPFQEAVGAAYSFVPFIIILALCIVLMAFFLPETRNRSIEDIVGEFRSRSRSMTMLIRKKSTRHQRSNIDNVVEEEEAKLLAEKVAEFVAEHKNYGSTEDPNAVASRDRPATFHGKAEPS